MRALITGAGGFVGPYLFKELTGAGYEVAGTYYTKRPSLAKEASLFQVDVRDREALREVVQEVKPDVVFHLAALAHPARSFESRKEVRAVNVGGTENLLLSLGEADLRPQFLFVGSMQEYGVPLSLPITEDHPLAPVNPYAASKVEAEEVVRSFADQMTVFITRSFNHTGPGHSPRFVLASFARQIAACERGEGEPVIRAGNLSVKRDFLHVLDVVRAYRAIVERGHAGEAYNVARGEAYELRDLLQRLAALAGIELTVVEDPKLFRPNDPPVMVGDRGKLTRHTGWEPRISIDDLLKDLLSYWRTPPLTAWRG